MSRSTLETLGVSSLSYTGLSPSMADLSRVVLLAISFLTPHCAPKPPTSVDLGFRLVPVRSPLLGESLLLSFPNGTEMFQFPSFAPLTR